MVCLSLVSLQHLTKGLPSPNVIHLFQNYKHFNYLFFQYIFLIIHHGTHFVKTEKRQFCKAINGWFFVDFLSCLHCSSILAVNPSTLDSTGLFLKSEISSYRFERGSITLVVAVVCLFGGLSFLSLARFDEK